MVDLSAQPFHLSDEDIAWVEATIGAMTVEEKIGQLFINLNGRFDDEYVTGIIDKYHVGGMRYQHTSAAEVQSHIRVAQRHSKIPLLVASNIEAGGNGACTDGTHVATPLQVGSAPDVDAAYRMGYVGGVESAAIGCNWAFAPIVDVHYNWRNTVIATRAFGNDPDVVIKHAKSYADGVRQQNIALAMKHFPGDGLDERDQHVVTSYNTQTVQEWDDSFGRIYREMIDYGIQSIMVGHIALPAYQRKLRPGITDREILPATLSPELVTDLLRGQLGFNGLILTDASLMVGMTQAMRRRDQVPAAIAAGCDMFLFFKDPDEDFGYMLDGYRSGVITQARLDDALHRILGLKASLGLHRLQEQDGLVPDESALQRVGCPEHHDIAAQIADRTVTLLKDTEGNLPLNPDRHRRIRLFAIAGDPDFTGAPSTEFKDIAIEELTRAGFDVHPYQNFAEQKAAGRADLAFADFLQEETHGFAEKYDAAIILANISDFASQAALRIRWSSPMAPEIPWYAREVPTVFVSLNMPNHLIDVPMVRTAINAHVPTREAIRAVVDKITGKSEFQGTFNDNVFCDSPDTRL